MNLNGNVACGGIAVAPAYKYVPYNSTVHEAMLDGMCVKDAVEAVRCAIAAANQELTALIASGNQEQAAILTAHKEILQDEELSDAIVEHIESNGYAPEFAVYVACNEFISLLSSVRDSNIAMRKADIADVRNRLVRCLRGETAKSLAKLEGDCIVIAHELLPSDTASIDRTHVLGIITETGGMTSHTAILARSYQIPALLGVHDAMEQICDAQTIVLDAQNGIAITDPNTDELGSAHKRRAEWLRERDTAAVFLNRDIFTHDGAKIAFGANIGSEQDAIPDCADFIGLFRTEFLYMNSSHLPTEDEQFLAYRDVLTLAKGKPVTLRTLDIGGDKSLPYLPLPNEDNPFLGVRAIRLCFARPELLITQLRAAYRASVYGNLQIMFPMIADVEDYRRARAIAEEVQKQLADEKIPFSCVPLGVMIEIPSAAITADALADEVDFASIGTNDLCQYLFAADRMNPALTEYNRPCSSAMLRLLQSVAQAFRAAKKPLSVCGEMAGQVEGAKALAKLGILKLSMSVGSMVEVKAALAAEYRKDE